MSCETPKLNDTSTPIRHSPKNRFDGNVPSFKAFLFSDSELEEEEPFLSFSWLEKLCADASVPENHNSAITVLEREDGFPRDIKKGEKWIFLSCDRIRAALILVPDCTPQIFRKPIKHFDSHVGVSGYNKSQHEQAATELWKKVLPENIRNVTKSRKKKKYY